MTVIHTKRQTIEEDVLRDLIECLRETYTSACTGPGYVDGAIDDIREFARNRGLNDLGGK